MDDILSKLKEVKDQLILERHNYNYAFRVNKTFDQIKGIRQKIKSLEAKLAALEEQIK